MTELLDDTQLNVEREAYQNCLRLTRRCVKALDQIGKDVNGKNAFATSSAVESLAAVSTFLDTDNVAIEQQRWADLVPILKKALDMNSTVQAKMPPAKKTTTPATSRKALAIPRQPCDIIQPTKFLKTEALRVLSTFVRHTEANRETLAKEFLDELEVMMHTVGLSAEMQGVLQDNLKKKNATSSEIHIKSLLKSLGFFFSKWFIRPSDEILQKITFDMVCGDLEVGEREGEREGGGSYASYCSLSPLRETDRQPWGFFTQKAEYALYFEKL
jgi:hypothetical protein